MGVVAGLLAVLASALLVAGPTASARGGTARAVEEVALARQGDELQVVQVVSVPGGGTFPLLPGHEAVTVPPGATAVLSHGAFSPPAGGSFAEVRYNVPLRGRSGLLTHLQLPRRLDGLWILAGPGVSFPVVLNQAFFAQGRTEQLGVSYEAYLAGPVGPGVLPLRLEFPAQGSLLPWLWAPLAAALAAWLLFVRRRGHAERG